MSGIHSRTMAAVSCAAIAAFERARAAAISSDAVDWVTEVRAGGV
jgi:hypothetical protein